MSKRFAESDGHEARDNKRPKTQPPVAVIPATDIFSARQLQELLSFSQDGVQDLRNGPFSVLILCNPIADPL